MRFRNIAIRIFCNSIRCNFDILRLDILLFGILPRSRGRVPPPRIIIPSTCEDQYLRSPRPSKVLIPRVSNCSFPVTPVLHDTIRAVRSRLRRFSRTYLARRGGRRTPALALAPGSPTDRPTDRPSSERGWGLAVQESKAGPRWSVAWVGTPGRGTDLDGRGLEQTSERAPSCATMGGNGKKVGVVGR